ncbi:MAG: HD domain-containing protein [Bacilli bacterium]|nr:HD domain-containing protein [Bacilli bacterium]
MYYSEKVKQAMIDSFNAHKNDIDKSGYPYFHHPLTLALQFDDETSVIVALLHDVVEDHGDKYPLSYIRKEFGDEVADTVDLLTHRKGVPYMDYVKVIKENPIARRVKLADLRNNTDLRRCNPGQKPPKYELYLEAIKYLEC